MFVGMCKGIIIPAFLRWCRVSSIHSRGPQDPLVSLWFPCTCKNMGTKLVGTILVNGLGCRTSYWKTAVRCFGAMSCRCSCNSPSPLNGTGQELAAARDAGNEKWHDAEIHHTTRLELGPQQKTMFFFFDWQWKTKGTPKNQKHQRGELILGKTRPGNRQSSGQPTTKKEALARSPGKARILWCLEPEQGSLHHTPEHCIANGVPLFWC